MTAVLAPPVLARQVAAIQVPVTIPADIWTPREETGHTWRWKCGHCGLRSFATFLTAQDADRAGQDHTCREAQP